MLVQLLPELSQSCHAYLKLVGLLLHEPLVVVSVWPCVAVPLTAGAAVFAGGSGTTVAVGSELAVPDPSRLLAVTTDRIVWPTSAAVSV